MATQWYWRAEEMTCGPVSFQELVGMVRDRALDEDDLVRPDYTQEWQTTDTVVGLFYMARRTPVPREVAPDAVSVIPNGDGLDDAGVGTEAGGQVYRMEDVTRGKDLIGGEFELADMLAGAPDFDGLGVEANRSPSSGGFEDVAMGTSGSGSSQWDSIVQAAVDRVDARAA
ncbi:MAG: DUF4339 domain-containing protein, partial [Candidatus Saccharimonas sp.]|nr:DUF4339 domain-containing protein [Planctomycetaceae bacterium]